MRAHASSVGAPALATSPRVAVPVLLQKIPRPPARSSQVTAVQWHSLSDIARTKNHPIPIHKTLGEARAQTSSAGGILDMDQVKGEIHTMPGSILLGFPRASSSFEFPGRGLSLY